MPATKRAFIHDNFSVHTDENTKKVTITCKYCNQYKAAKNTTRQHQHLTECQPYLRAMHDAGITNEITETVMRSDAVPDSMALQQSEMGISMGSNLGGMIPDMMPAHPHTQPQPMKKAKITPAIEPIASQVSRSTTTTRKGLSLQGKVAIVSGGSRGIGAGIALRLASLGCRVAITYVSESSTPLASALIAEIKSLPARTSAISIRADLRLATAPAFIVSTVTAAFGKHVDILINNAGCYIPRKLGEIEPEDWSQTWDLNVRAVVFLTNAVRKVMRTSGRIINILGPSTNSISFGDASLYHASKAAVESLTKTWSSQLLSVGTTVNAIQPPLVRGQSGNNSLHDSPRATNEIAHTVGWLCDEASRYVTGQVIDCASVAGIADNSTNLNYDLEGVGKK